MNHRLTFLLLMLIVPVLSLTPSTNAVFGQTSPQIGSSKTTVDRTWQRTGGKCSGSSTFYVCYYKAWFNKFLSIGVAFNKGHATEFDFSFDPDTYTNYPSPASHSYWTYLVGLLPPHMHKSTCKYFAHTAGPGVAANACIYRYGKHDVLVAQYLAQDGNGVLGTVRLDSDFTDIT